MDLVGKSVRFISWSFFLVPEERTQREFVYYILSSKIQQKFKSLF